MGDGKKKSNSKKKQVWMRAKDYWKGFMEGATDDDQLKRKLFIIVPVFALFVLVFNPLAKIELEREVVDGVVMIHVDKQRFSNSTPENMIRYILKVPFDLEWYNIYFHNVGAVNISSSSGDKDYLNYTVIINFNNESEHTILFNQTKIIPIKFDKDFTYRCIWSKSELEKEENFCKIYTMAIDDKCNQVGLRYGCNMMAEYASPTPNSSAAIFLLIFVYWCGLLWLITRVRKFINEGWNI